MENLITLVINLCRQSSETEWLEFKHNNYDHEMIGEDISALANSAACLAKNRAYMIWGVDDKTHQIIGTNKSHYELKVGNEELECWLHRLLSKNARFEFNTIEMPSEGGSRKVILLIIEKAFGQPVTFKNNEYIRIGSYTKSLNDSPVKRMVLWERLCAETMEERIAEASLTVQEVFDRLDLTPYFTLQNIPTPSSKEELLRTMQKEGLVVFQDDGLWGITNLGAILFAKDLQFFPNLARKEVRIVQYQGNNKSKIQKECRINTGYVIGFEEIMEVLSLLLPGQILFVDGLRTDVCSYSRIALREAIANALIHQDFTITGTGPVIELFERRIEISNPGESLVEAKRIIDTPPTSRNERLASLMRRLRICEELGSGWDRMVLDCECHQLPSPRIQPYPKATLVTLFSHIQFSEMTSDDKLWSCYLHACVKHISGEALTNTTLRERFGLPKTAASPISRLIKNTMESKLIKPVDPDTAPKHMRYVPFWA